MASLNDAVQYALRTLKTAGEVVRKWYELTLAPPKDVQVEVYDEKGNLINETLPNYRKQLQTLLQDKKNLPFYSGGDITTEQELRDFINNVPIRGRGKVRIVAPITLTAPLYFADGKHITLEIDATAGGRLIFKAYEQNGVKKLSRIHIDNGSFLHISVQGDITQPVFSVDLSGVNAATPWSTWNGDKAPFLIVHSELRLECSKVSSQNDKVIFDFSVDPNLFVALVARSKLFINGNWTDANGNPRMGYIKLADPNQVIFDLQKNYCGFSAGIRLMDANGNDLYTGGVNWNNHITGIVRDANGLPRNVITPHVL